MKQYFSIDSTIFTIVALGFILIGSPIWLLILSVLTIIFLITKSGLSKNKQRADKGDIWANLIIWGCLSILFFGASGLGLVLFGYWFYILYQVYIA